MNSCDGVHRMNQLSNPKIDLSLTLLAENSKAIVEQKIAPDNNLIRTLVDERRQIKADIQIEKTQFDTTIASRDSISDKLNEEAEDFVATWITGLKSAHVGAVDFENEHFCQIFLDQILPKVWHFKNNAIVIIDPPSQTISNCAKGRGQQHIITYYSGEKTDRCLLNETIRPSNLICKSLEDLEKAFALIQIPAGQVITIPCTPQTEENQRSIIDSVNAGKRTRFENTRTVSKFGKPWATNVIKNLPSLTDAFNLHQLKVDGVKDAVVVASGPSLNKNVSLLKEVQEDVFIVAALRSLPVLNAAGVTPDLVIQLDAESDEVALALSPDPNFPVKNFLYDLMVNPGFLKIPADKYLWSLGQHFFDIHDALDTRPTPFMAPSVSIYSLELCHFLGFQSICFIGQDLAAEGDNQYAEGATNLLPRHSNMSMFHIKVPGFFGGTVMTRNSFEYQIKRCGEIAKTWKNANPEINLVNATEGGAFIDGFSHMKLIEFIDQQKILKNRSNKKIWFDENVTISDITIDNYLAKTRAILDSIITLANQIIKLDLKPNKNKGLYKKIEKNIKKFQSLNDRTSLVQIAMQDSIAKNIGTSENGQKIDTHAEFFKKIKVCASELKTSSKS